MMATRGFAVAHVSISSRSVGDGLDLLGRRGGAGCDAHHPERPGTTLGPVRPPTPRGTCAAAGPRTARPDAACCPSSSPPPRPRRPRSAAMAMAAACRCSVALQMVLCTSNSAHAGRQMRHQFRQAAPATGWSAPPRRSGGWAVRRAGRPATRPPASPPRHTSGGPAPPGWSLSPRMTTR